MATPAKAAAAKKTQPLAVLSKEALLAAEDLEQMSVEIPEWGGSIVLRQLRRSEQVDAENAAIVDDEIDVNLLQLHTLGHAMVEPAFTPAEITALGEKNASVIGFVVTCQNVLQVGGKKSLVDFLKSID